MGKPMPKPKPAKRSVVRLTALPGFGSPNKLACIALISRYGFYQLGGGDGCLCSNFSLCGFEIEISCRKSEHCVRVYSSHLYRQATDCIEIASLILAQLGEDDANGYSTRYCEYENDHHNARWENEKWVVEYTCCYCCAPRHDEAAYLCKKCLGSKDAISRYPFGIEELARGCPKCGSPMVERDLLGLSEMAEEPVVLAGVKIGFSISGQFPKQGNEEIFRCLNCQHHWREERGVARAKDGKGK